MVEQIHKSHALEGLDQLSRYSQTLFCRARCVPRKVNHGERVDLVRNDVSTEGTHE